ncbi:receptor-like protein kinase FERONIA [Mercurialis annua]|uniref:receptor-like protein kinase FERONIA n=1 Tax=Mercurialis annua TaxID=3986 RepID=UPI002160CC65|nr:receptor-like protein kinase FERONIA [Mercurialis annua]
MNSCYGSFLIIIYLYFLLNILNCSSTNTSLTSLLDKVVLDCGSSESSSFNGKYWIGDVGSRFIPADSDKTQIFESSTPINQDVPKIPYSTARIFRSGFTYVFPFHPGYKFIRLLFYQSSYSGLGSDAYFSVVSCNYTLLNNFSPSLVASTSKLDYFTKEFVINLKDSLLNITIIPSSKAYAFINGIEIYSLPSNFQDYAVHDNDPAFQMMHRVNVGGRVFHETIWQDDSSYILGSMSGTIIHTPEITKDSWNMSEYVAPILLSSSARTMDSDDAINMSYNVTWTFGIDPGFKYLVRLHFCEILNEVTEANQRVFTVFINNKTVEKSLDVIALAGAPLVAIYRDYTVMVPQGTGDNQDLWLALHPNAESESKFQNAILNGVEIMKLSDEYNNLAPYFQPKMGRSRKKKVPLSIILGSILGCLGGLFMCFFFACRWFKIYHRQTNSKNQVIGQFWNCRKFTLADMRAATNNFDEALVIGVGGFGKVYKGVIDGGATDR